MAGPWEAYQPSAPAAEGPWTAYAPANDTAPALVPKRDIFSPLVDTVRGAFQQIGQDVQQDAAPTDTSKPVVQQFVDSFLHPTAPGGVLRGGKVLLDALGAAASPISGAVNMVAQPLDQATRFAGNPNQGLDLNQALMGLGAPEAGALKLPPAFDAVPVVKQPGAVGQVLAPFKAGLSKGAAEQQAAQQLASRATDLPAAQAALESPAELVPGSTPTTFQQTGDLGLGGLEREVASKNREAFAARRSDQNTARVNSLSNIQSGADPNDVAKALKGQFEDLDKATSADVQAATTDAQAKAAAVGGTANPEDLGASLRAATQAAEDAGKARVSSLYSAIDPDRTMTANVAQTAQAAKEIQGSIGKVARPMEGEEAAVFKLAGDMDHLSPLQDLTDLRSRVSDAMRDARGPNGNPQALRRLTQLRGAIEENLSTTIAHQVAMDDAAVARGTLPPDQALTSRLKGWVDEFNAERTAARSGGADSVGGVGAPSPLIDTGISGTAGETGRGPGGAQGAEGLPGNAPTVTPEAVDQLKTATAAARQQADTFKQGPVGRTLVSSGNKDQFRLPDGRVAQQFFHPGSTGFSDMQALFRAVPEAESLPIVQDYAATSLRRAAMDPDGTINPAKFQRWQSAHADSLRALPQSTRDKFATAARASETVADATAAKAATLREAQSGAIGKVMGLTSPEDVTRTVGQLMRGRTAVADIRALLKATAGNPEARQGLRQAVADNLTKLIGNTEAGTSGTGVIKADAYQTFVKETRAVLNLVFEPEEIRNIEAIAQDINRSKRSENAVKLPGSPNTAPDLAALQKSGAFKAGKTLLDALAGGIGATLGGGFGAVGGVISAHLLQSLRAAGIARVDELVTMAMLHPEIARELLKKAPLKADPNATRGLAIAIRKAAVAVPAAAQDRKRP